MKRVGKTGERYIHLQHGLYTIHKQVNGKQQSYGSFELLEDAIEHRDYCIQQDWSEDCKIRHKPKDLQYIFKISDGYQVAKNKDGVKRHYGYFNDLEEAKAHRDYCIEQDWSSDCVVRKNECHDLPRYVTYSRDKSRYAVQKKLGNGESVSIQSFKSLEDALLERDLLIRCDWDILKVIELDECEGTL